jgi:hypothetical protein
MNITVSTPMIWTRYPSVHVFSILGDEWKILLMGLDCGSSGSSLRDHLFWLNNNNSGEASVHGKRDTNVPQRLKSAKKRDIGEVFNFKKK